MSFHTVTVISTEGRNLMTKKHCYYLYLLANKNDKVMCVGVTNNLDGFVKSPSAALPPCDARRQALHAGYRY